MIKVGLGPQRREEKAAASTQINESEKEDTVKSCHNGLWTIKLKKTETSE